MRRAARDRGRLPLAEAAAAHGFADHAHMTRETRAFLGVTPGDIRAERGPAIHKGDGA
jgi:AraC-like DNA-binding protein